MRSVAVPDVLSDEAIALIQRSPETINYIANVIADKADIQKHLEQRVRGVTDDEIQHVGYTKEQCGYDK